MSVEHDNIFNREPNIDELALEAWESFDALFFTPEAPFPFSSFNEEDHNKRHKQLVRKQRTMHHVMRSYYNLIIRSAAEEISEENRNAYIQDGLIKQRILPKDEFDAAYTYEIISQAYILNKEKWHRMLGRARNFHRALEEMPAELGL